MARCAYHSKRFAAFATSLERERDAEAALQQQHVLDDVRGKILRCRLLHPDMHTKVKQQIRLDRDLASTSFEGIAKKMQVKR